MTHYFRAADDGEAAATVDDGPHRLMRVREVTEQAPRRGLGGLLRRPDPVARTVQEDHDVLRSKGMLPADELAVLEELLTGRPRDLVVQDPRWAHDVAERDEGEVVVMTVTDTLAAALADAPADRLREVAGLWAGDEVFYGSAEPGILADFLADLGDLARRARDHGDRLYCWVCV